MSGSCRFSKYRPMQFSKKILLLPPVQRRVELGLQSEGKPCQPCPAPVVQPPDLFQGGLVVRASRLPGFVAVAPEITLPQVFHPDQALGLVVEVDFGRAHAECVEHFRYPDVVTILFPLVVVLDQDERLLSQPDAVELPFRAAFFDGNDADGVVGGRGKANAGLPDERFLGKQGGRKVGRERGGRRATVRREPSCHRSFWKRGRYSFSAGHGKEYRHPATK